MTDYPIQCSWAVAVVYSIVVWLAGIGTASIAYYVKRREKQ